MKTPIRSKETTSSHRPPQYYDGDDRVELQPARHWRLTWYEIAILVYMAIMSVANLIMIGHILSWSAW